MENLTTQTLQRTIPAKPPTPHTFLPIPMDSLIRPSAAQLVVETITRPTPTHNHKSNPERPPPPPKSHLLQARIRSNGRHGIPLDQNVTVGEQLDGLQRAALGADDALPALDEALAVANHRADLDDVAGDVVLQHADGLESG